MVHLSGYEAPQPSLLADTVRRFDLVVITALGLALIVGVVIGCLWRCRKTKSSLQELAEFSQARRNDGAPRLVRSGGAE